MTTSLAALLILAIALSLAWWALASRSLRSSWARWLLLALVVAQAALLLDLALAPTREGMHAPASPVRTLLRLGSLGWHALCVPLGLLLLGAAGLRRARVLRSRP